jgi:hypothetical protein
MRSPTPAGILFGVLLFAAPAAAQTMDAPPPPPPAPMPPPPAPTPPPASMPAPPAPAAPQTPVFDPGSSPSDLTGTPNPTALSPSTGDEFRFSSHGFLRAPLRIGAGNRPNCPAGAAPGTAVGPSGNLNPTGVSVPCASGGQSTLNLHSPMVPDDQYLDPRYTRQWEKDWTEVFLNYGNSHVVGTVSFQAFGLTDAEHLSADNIGSQLGIAQAYVTLTPTIEPKARVSWKVGSFWDKYGMSGKYDAGKYDMYLFGRTHTMGETLAGEYDVGDVTLRAAQGLGVKDEELQFTALSAPFPGFTLLNHLHVGASYKKMLDVNFHYLVAWAQDARVTSGTAIQSGYVAAGVPDGKEDVAGIEARFTGGVAGEIYVGYSHVGAQHVQEVGPALEVISSLGGYGQAGTGPSGSYYGPNGLMDNYLGTCPKCTPNQVGTGSIDSVLVQYDYSFGLLWRKLKNPNAGFWGDGPDVTLAVFGLYQAVSSTDTSGINPLLGDGVKKLKYGGDLVFNMISWFGVGVRGDLVQPTSLDAHQSFGVLSPKLIFRSKFVTHEEITAQYSHYWYGSDVAPQPPYGTPPSAPGAPFTGYPPDANVFGIKATMWW